MSKSNSTRVVRNCETCSKPFLFKAFPSSIKLGRGRFCSKDCQRQWQTIPLIDRFFRYIGRKMPNGCIPWTGCDNGYGYGVITESSQQGRMLMASHVSYELFVGAIPEGLHVLHRCDYPPCINPVHLFVGTPAVNMADKVSKGRQTRGEVIPWASLTEEMVRWAREQYATGTVSYQSLADQCGVTYNPMRLAILRETWKHVD